MGFCFVLFFVVFFGASLILFFFFGLLLFCLFVCFFGPFLVEVAAGFLELMVGVLARI